MFWLRHLYHTVYVTRERGTSDDPPCMKNKESQRIFQQLDLQRLEKIYLIFFFGTNFIFLFVVIIRGEVSDYFYLHYDVSCVP